MVHPVVACKRLGPGVPVTKVWSGRFGVEHASLGRLRENQKRCFGLLALDDPLTVQSGVHPPHVD